MKRPFFLFLLLTSVKVFAQDSLPPTPHQLYGQLFVKVQMEGIFPDNKTFVDCTAKFPPEEIIKKYEAQKDDSLFDLKKFVLANFNLPVNKTDTYKSDISKGITAHINELWKVLKRQPDEEVKFSSLVPLRYPYIVPGGRFREIYYWDSYFTMLGLEASDQKQMLENMVRNFAYLVNQFDYIPNGNRTYYLTRSQPPFFSLMIQLLANNKGNFVYATYQPVLLKEYNYWMRGADQLTPGEAHDNVVKMPGGEILNRYYGGGEGPRDEAFKHDSLIAKAAGRPLRATYKNIRGACESGWDFSSRWFKDGKDINTIRTTDIVPADLNSLLYHLEQAIAISYDVSGNKLQAKLYYNKAQQRKEAIRKYLWNKKKGFYTDYLIKEKKPSDELTLAGMSPLFFNIADSIQAVKTAKIIKEKFLKPGGVVTTLVNTGEQWDAPNGWAPLEYLTIEGLENYGYHDLAKKIALNWIDLNVAVFRNTGKLMEKYDVEDTSLKAGGGEYQTQDGFGWTNGVLLKLMHQYNVSE